MRERFFKGSGMVGMLGHAGATQGVNQLLLVVRVKSGKSGRCTAQEGAQVIQRGSGHDVLVFLFSELWGLFMDHDAGAQGRTLTRDRKVL
jgi:hypothetical protein